MIDYRVIAIPDSTAAAVRRDMTSPGYGHPAHAETATGYGPCRSCLATFEEGAERRILFTYDAFAEVEDLPLPGPVYIHERACETYPENGGFPADLRDLPLTFNAYGPHRKLLAQEYASGPEVDTVLQELLALPGLVQVHVRNTEVGCYIARIEPLNGTAPAGRS